MGASLLVTDPHGVCGSAPLTGYYFRETRHLSRVRLRFDGESAWLSEAAQPTAPQVRLLFVYPEVTAYGGGGSGQSGDDVPRNAAGIPQRALIAALDYDLSPSALKISVTTTNVARERVSCELAIELDADFADIQEAQGGTRQQTAGVDVRADRGDVVFDYRHDRLPYRTRVEFTNGLAWDAERRRLTAPIALQPSASVRFDVSVVPSQPRISASGTIELGGSEDPPFFAPSQPGAGAGGTDAERRGAVDRWRESFARVAAPGNRHFEAVMSANAADLGSFPLLEGPPDEWLAPQAGIPLYPAFFGRDGLTAGWQMAMLDRGEALDAALTKLARRQGRRDDPWRDEEPGRIPYQMRLGPLAVLGLNPYEAYYADFASPLMFVISLANLFAWTGDARCLDRHWDTARRILDWARERGDRDGDGYLEYLTRSSNGTKNQGWKDSGDAIVYDDGSLVQPPIATCELQGYWYAAQQLMGLLCGVRGQTREARAHLDAAADLKARFNRDWWSDEEQCFGLALDPDKRLVAAPSSNVGHCLASGIVDADHLRPVVGRLFAPDLFSGWGVRTLSSAHAAYDPLSYHRGSVWAVEQATILFGLRRFGFDARVHDLAEALFALALLYPGYRIPETIGGYSRRERATPGAYPQANAPQLWNASAFPLAIQSLLGLVPWADRQVLLVDPILPAWLPELVVHGLRVGDAAVTLRFWRTASGSSEFDVIAKRGRLRIVRQPPPESIAAGAWDRIAALTDSVIA
jgi:glycogen debranching enzyme